MGGRVRWLLTGMGTENDMHSPVWHNQVGHRAKLPLSPGTATWRPPLRLELKHGPHSCVSFGLHPSCSLNSTLGRLSGDEPPAMPQVHQPLPEGLITHRSSLTVTGHAA